MFSYASARIVLTSIQESLVKVEDPTDASQEKRVGLYTINVRCDVGDRALLGEITRAANVSIPDGLKIDLDVEIWCEHITTWYDLFNVTRVPLGSGVVSVISGVDAQIGYHSSLDRIAREKQERKEAAEQNMRKRNLEAFEQRAGGRKRVWGAVAAVAVGVGVLVFGSALRASNSKDCAELEGNRGITTRSRTSILETCVSELTRSIREVESGFKDTMEAYSELIADTLLGIISLTDNLQEQVWATGNYTEEINGQLQETIAVSQQALTLAQQNAEAVGDVAEELTETQQIMNENFDAVEDQFEQAAAERDAIVNAFNLELQNMQENFEAFAGAVENEIKLIYERMYLSFSQMNDQISKLDVDTSVRLSSIAKQTEDALNKLSGDTARLNAEQERIYGLINALYNTIKELTQLQYSAADLIIAYWFSIDKLLAQGDDIEIFLDELGDRPMNLRDWNYIGAREFKGKAWTYQEDEDCTQTSIVDVAGKMDTHYRDRKAAWDLPISNMQRYHHFFSDHFQLHSTRDEGKSVRVSWCYNAGSTQTAPPPTDTFSGNPFVAVINSDPEGYICHRELSNNETYNKYYGDGPLFCPQALTGNAGAVECGNPGLSNWQHAAAEPLDFIAVPIFTDTIQGNIKAGDVVAFKVVEAGNIQPNSLATLVYYLVRSSNETLHQPLTLRAFNSDDEAQNNTDAYFLVDFQRSASGRVAWREQDEEVSFQFPYLSDDSCVVLKPFQEALELSDGYTATSPEVDPFPTTQNAFPRYRYTLGLGAGDIDCMKFKRTNLGSTRKRSIAPPPFSGGTRKRSFDSRQVTRNNLRTNHQSMMCQIVWDNHMEGKDKNFQTTGGVYIYKRGASHTIAEMEALDAAIRPQGGQSCTSRPGCMLASVVQPRIGWVKEDGYPTRETDFIRPGLPVEYVRQNREAKTLLLIVPNGIKAEVCSSNPDAESVSLVICNEFNGPTMNQPSDNVIGTATLEIVSDTFTYLVTIPETRNTKIRFMLQDDAEPEYYKATCVSSNDFGTATQAQILGPSSSAIVRRDAFQAACTNQDINTYNAIFITSLEHRDRVVANTLHDVGFFDITMGTIAHTARWTGIRATSVSVESTGSTDVSTTGADFGYLNSAGNPVAPLTTSKMDLAVEDINVLYQAPLRRCWDMCRTVQGDEAYQKDICDTILGEKCTWRINASPLQNTCEPRDDTTGGAFVSCEAALAGAGEIDDAWECMQRGESVLGCTYNPSSNLPTKCSDYSVDPKAPARTRTSCSARIVDPDDAYGCATADTKYLDQEMVLNYGTIMTDMCFYQFDRAQHSLNQQTNWCLPIKAEPGLSLLSYIDDNSDIPVGYRCMNAGVDCQFGLYDTRRAFFATMEPPNPVRGNVDHFRDDFNIRNWRGERGCGAYDRFIWECGTKSVSPSMAALVGAPATTEFCEATSAVCTQRCMFHRTARDCVNAAYTGKCTWVFDQEDHWKPIEISGEALTLFEGTTSTNTQVYPADNVEQKGYYAHFPGWVIVEVEGVAASVDVAWDVVVSGDQGSESNVGLPYRNEDIWVEPRSLVFVTIHDPQATNEGRTIRVYYKPMAEKGYCTDNKFITSSDFNTCGTSGRGCANVQSYCNIYNNYYEEVNGEMVHAYDATNDFFNASDRTRCLRDERCLWINEMLDGTGIDNTTGYNPRAYCASYARINSYNCEGHSSATPLTPHQECTVRNLKGIEGAIEQLHGQCIIPQEGEAWNDCIDVMRNRGIEDTMQQRIRCNMEICIETRENPDANNPQICKADDRYCGHCVFVSIGDTGTTHCYAPGDPNIRRLEEQYTGLAQVVRYEDYIMRNTTAVLEDISLAELNSVMVLRDPTMVASTPVSDVPGHSGVRGVPDSYEVFFQCEDRDLPVQLTDGSWINYTYHFRPVGRQCCELSVIKTDVQAGEEFERCEDDGSGKVYLNENHPRLLYHEKALESCPMPTEGTKRDKYLQERSLSTYYFCRVDRYDGALGPNTQEQNPDACAFGSETNTTGVSPYSDMYCFPFIRLDECRAGGICERLPSPTACVITADIGSTGHSEQFVRIDRTAITALQETEKYNLYNGKRYAITTWTEIESARYGGPVDLRVNGSSIEPITVFPVLFERDIRVLSTTMLAFFGNKVQAWGGTLGDVESITRNNVKMRMADGSSRRLLQQYEAKYAWRTKTTVPVYRYRSRKRTCGGRWLEYKKDDGDFSQQRLNFDPTDPERTVHSVSCLAYSDYESELPVEYDEMIHFISEKYNVVVSPPTKRIAIGGSKGQIGAFHTFGAEDITRQDFLKRVPTYDPEIFQTSPWLYSNPIDPDNKWCGFMLRSGPDDTGFKVSIEADGTTRGLGIEALVNLKEIIKINATIPANYAGTGAGEGLTTYWKRVLEDEETLYGQCAGADVNDIEKCTTASVWLTRIANATANHWIFYGCSMPFTNFAIGPDASEQVGVDVLHILWDGFLCHVGNITVPSGSTQYHDAILEDLCPFGGSPQEAANYYKRFVDTEGQQSDQPTILEEVVTNSFIVPRKFAQCGNCLNVNGTGFCDVPDYIPPMESDLSARYGLCMLSQHFDIEWDDEAGQIFFHAKPKTGVMDLSFQVRLESPLAPASHTGLRCPNGQISDQVVPAEMHCDPVFRQCHVKLYNPDRNRNMDIVRLVTTSEDCQLIGFNSLQVNGNKTLWARRDVIGPWNGEEFTYDLCPGQFDIQHIPSLRLEEAGQPDSMVCNHTRFLVQIARVREEESFVSLFGSGLVQVVGDITLSNFGRAFEELTDQIVASQLTEVVYTKEEIRLVVGQSVAESTLNLADQFLGFIEGVDLSDILTPGIGAIVNNWTYDRTNESAIRDSSNPDFLGDVYDHVEDVRNQVDDLNNSYSEIIDSLKNASDNYAEQIGNLSSEYQDLRGDVMDQIEQIRNFSFDFGGGLEPGEGGGLSPAEIGLIIMGVILGLLLIGGGVGGAVYYTQTQAKKEQEEEDALLAAFSSPESATKKLTTAEKLRYYNLKDS